MSGGRAKMKKVNWGQPITDYRIVLPRDYYFAGETVQGTLELKTHGPISCRGVRVKLEGVGMCHWHYYEGAGEHRRRVDVHGEKKYNGCQKTAWGSTYNTGRIDNAGDDAVWGHPTTPDEGHVDMPLQTAHGSKVVLRVMDYDWGTKDDELGECLLDVDELLAMNGADVTVPLWRHAGKGVFSSGAYGPAEGNASNGVKPRSVVVLSCELSELEGGFGFQQGARRVVFKVKSAHNLRDADSMMGFRGYNDVYCQLYEVSGEDLAPGLPLPGPPDTSAMQLPPTRASIPFSFRLPRNLPSSMEPLDVFAEPVDRASVRYCIYSHIDIAWRMDPSCRRIISVINGPSSTIPKLLAPLRSVPQEKEVHPVNCESLCFCCSKDCVGQLCGENKSVSLGKVFLDCHMDRRGYAPGETMFLSGIARNETDRPVMVYVSLVRTIVYTAKDGFTHKTRTARGEIPLASFEVPAHSTWQLEDGQLICPAIASDYFGGYGYDEEFASRNAQYGARYSERLVDPVKWSTKLMVLMDVPDTPFNLKQFMDVLITGLPGNPIVWEEYQQKRKGAALSMPALPGAQEMTPRRSGDDIGVSVLGTAECPTWTPGAEDEQVRGDTLCIARTDEISAADPQEDIKCDPAELTYSPAVAVYKPAAPRKCRSPYKPDNPEVDCTMNPPGSKMICPYTGMPFVVPPPPPPQAQVISTVAAPSMSMV